MNGRVSSHIMKMPLFRREGQLINVERGIEWGGVSEAEPCDGEGGVVSADASLEEAVEISAAITPSEGVKQEDENECYNCTC